MSKILSIVIPCYNKFNFTKSCLTDLSKLPNDHEIIIIDNGSSDETKLQLESSKEITYHRNDINLGFARASNIGYGLSTANNVLFLNNDIRVKSGIYGDYTNWTKPLLDYCDKGLVGPTMGQLDNNFNFIREANEKLNGNSYMSGWCVASSKDIWNKLNIPRDMTEKHIPQIFSEDFFCYFEDSDLSMRAKKLGIAMEVVKLSVVHFGKISSGQLNTHKLYVDGKKIFMKKWAIP